MTPDAASANGTHWHPWGHGHGREPRGPACFARGTHILTDRGEVVVETLRIGDRIRTMDGTFSPIRWIGRRRYVRRGPGWPADIKPIRIARDAIADGVPHRDLYVSPKHMLHFDGYLMPAKDLVNDATIVPHWPAGRATIEYFHILLDPHAVIFAEGAEAESLQLRPGSDEAFSNFAEFRRLRGEEPAPVPACLPKVGYWRGRSHLTALLRLGVSPIVDLPDPIQRVRRRLDTRARIRGSVAV